MDGFLRRPESAVEQSEAVQRFIRSWWPAIRWAATIATVVGTGWWWSLSVGNSARGEYDRITNTLSAHDTHLTKIDSTAEKVAEALDKLAREISNLKGFIDGQGQRRGSVQPMPETLEVPG